MLRALEHRRAWRCVGCAGLRGTVRITRPGRKSDRYQIAADPRLPVHLTGPCAPPFRRSAGPPRPLLPQFPSSSSSALPFPPKPFLEASTTWPRAAPSSQCALRLSEVLRRWPSPLYPKAKLRVFPYRLTARTVETVQTCPPPFFFCAAKSDAVPLFSTHTALPCPSLRLSDLQPHPAACPWVHLVNTTSEGPPSASATVRLSEFGSVVVAGALCVVF